jgi:hypothetical protein
MKPGLQFAIVLWCGDDEEPHPEVGSIAQLKRLKRTLLDHLLRLTTKSNPPAQQSARERFQYIKEETKKRL